MPVYTYTTIDDPLATTRTSARDINNAGQIVGEYIDSSNHLHGFLLSGGTYTILDDPLATPGAGTSAYGINASEADRRQVHGRQQPRARLSLERRHLHHPRLFHDQYYHRGMGH